MLFSPFPISSYLRLTNTISLHLYETSSLLHTRGNALSLTLSLCLFYLSPPLSSSVSNYSSICLSRALSPKFTHHVSLPLYLDGLPSPNLISPLDWATSRTRRRWHLERHHGEHTHRYHSRLRWSSRPTKEGMYNPIETHSCTFLQQTMKHFMMCHSSYHYYY